MFSRRVWVGVGLFAGLALGAARPLASTADGSFPYRVFSPQVARDETQRTEQIVYQSEGILVINADGTGQRRLTERSQEGSSPMASPVGSRIAFQSNVVFGPSDGFSSPVVSGDLTVMSSDGAGRTNLTPGDVPRLVNAGQYTWSPDGQKLAFVGDADLWLVGADGSGLVNLTHGRVTTEYIVGAGSTPSWSLDGEWIVFAAGGLQVVAPDGTGLHQLTNGLRPGDPLPPEPYPPEVARPLYKPTWSPDGRFVAYESGGLWVVGADGSPPIEILDSSGRCHFYDADWAADSEWLAVTGRCGGRDQVFLVNRNGTETVPLSDGTVNSSHPVWSPNGKHLAFSSWDPGAGGFGVYLMNADGSGRVRLSHAAERFADRFGGPPFSWLVQD